MRSTILLALAIALVPPAAAVSDLFFETIVAKPVAPTTSAAGSYDGYLVDVPAGSTLRMRLAWADGPSSLGLGYYAYSGTYNDGCPITDVGCIATTAPGWTLNALTSIDPACPGMEGSFLSGTRAIEMTYEAETDVHVGVIVMPSVLVEDTDYTLALVVDGAPQGRLEQDDGFAVWAPWSALCGL